MGVVAERTYRGLTFHRLSITRAGDKGRPSDWRTVMDDNPELATSPIHLYAVALSGVARHRVAKDERTGQWEAVTALLTRKGDCPQVAPRLLALDHWVDLGHALGVPLADLAQDKADVVEETTARVQGDSGTEGQIRLTGPVAEREVGEKLTRERGNGRVVDPVSGRPEARRFERDHGAAAEGVEHGSAIGIGLRKLRYQFIVSSVPARHRRTHEVLEPSLFDLVLGPRQETREDRRLGLRDWPCGEPREQCLLALAAAPAALGRLADFCTREPPFDHPHVTDSSFSRAALSALPGTCTMTAPADTSAKVRAGSG